MQVYLGIGSNQNAEVNVARAIGILRQVFGCLAISPLYRTPAVGFSGADFLNGALQLQTLMSIDQVRQECQQVERLIGRRREREQGCGSRCIDLDLLLFRDGERDLQPPHPDVFQQGYTALPLSRLLPNWTHSELGQRSYAAYVQAMGWEGVFEQWLQAEPA